MPTTESPAEPDGPEVPDATSSRTPDDRRADRGGIAVAAVLLLLCGAFVVYGVLNTEDEAAEKRATAPAAEVTYDVTYEVLGEGRADISYRGADGDKANVVTGAGLPWRKTVSVPLGASPIVNVTLGEKGGTASCTLTVRGRHVQRATATGAFGRTTCSGELGLSER
ncbi:MmpS family transport accessory protein [Streptomyces sp. NPDC059352]|uniref:MmpS family transport accessory protein n=1 Tax=Streptomyces sp. NPDC059352 TaxID=3346810 RepID=UPI0036C01FCE